MNLDTNIALGYKPTPIDFNAMNQGNVLANMAQLRSADNQNALAQYQLASAKRGDESQAALMKDAQDPNFKMTFANAIKYGPLGMTALKAQQDAETQALGQEETKGKIASNTFKLTQDKLKHGWTSMGEASTPQAAIEKLKDGVKKGYFDEPTALKEAQLIMDMTPEQYKQYRIKKIMGLLDAKDQLSAMLPKTVRQDTGSAITSIQDNPLLDGYGKPIAGADITKTQTFADLTAAAQATTSAGQLKVAQGNAATSAGQLTLAQKKFAFEKANPGMTYVEGPSGTAFGYNPKTNQMTPITNAPAAGTNAMAPAAGPNTNALAAPAPAQAVAPSAAPVAQPPAAAGTAGPMGITLPANAAAGVNAPGTPFVGKGASKPIPDNINLAILKNDQNIKSLQNTINLLAKNPDAVGVKGYMPQAVLNRKDPKGVDARAGIADIGSLVLHDRSGAAVTASESPRLMPFIPLITDDIKTATKKLTRMLEIAKDDQLGLTQTYSKEQGYAVNPIARQSNSSNQAGDIHSQADAVLRGNQ